MSIDRSIQKLQGRAADSWEDLDQALGKLDPSNPKDMEEYYELIKSFKTDHGMEDESRQMAHNMIKDSIQDIK